MDSAGPEATKLAASAGLQLDPWQADVLDVALGEREDGRWAAREVALVVPRQNGKGSILEALLVASLVLFEERLILYSAHEFKTAQETYLRVKSLIQSSDALMSRGPKFYNAHGSEGVEFADGARLRFVARTKGSGRGFSPQRVILDEALNLSSRSVSALLFAMSAQDNPQIWYTSSAPEDTPEGEVLRGIMRRGREGSPGLAYMEFCAPNGADPNDEAAVIAANPGWLNRPGLNPDQIATERLIATPEDFARERCGIVDLDTEVFKVVDAQQWRDRLNPKSRAGQPVQYALDVSPLSKTCAVSASDGTHVEIVKHDKGTAWVVQGCIDKGVKRITLDPTGPAGSLVQPLENAGVEVHQLTAREAQAACEQFLTSVTDGNLLHIGQPELDAAVANADKRDIGDGNWLWARVRSSVDICPLVAATWAKWAAGEATAPTPAFVDLNDFMDEE